mmetsp:Transcript_81435/g.263775  ORF Transcript_81435/g.263775 Transcript_81435/m.263775 type:complete len:236 (+) Transcript_81435:1352-2059(+)
MRPRGAPRAGGPHFRGRRRRAPPRFRCWPPAAPRPKAARAARGPRARARGRPELPSRREAGPRGASQAVAAAAAAATRPGGLAAARSARRPSGAPWASPRSWHLLRFGVQEERRLWQRMYSWSTAPSSWPASGAVSKRSQGLRQLRFRRRRPAWSRPWCRPTRTSRTWSRRSGGSSAASTRAVSCGRGRGLSSLQQTRLRSSVCSSRTLLGGLRQWAERGPARPSLERLGVSFPC